MRLQSVESQAQASRPDGVGLRRWPGLSPRAQQPCGPCAVPWTQQQQQPQQQPQQQQQQQQQQQRVEVPCARARARGAPARRPGWPSAPAPCRWLQRPACAGRSGWPSPSCAWAAAPPGWPALHDSAAHQRHRLCDGRAQRVLGSGQAKQVLGARQSWRQSCTRMGADRPSHLCTRLAVLAAPMQRSVRPARHQAMAAGRGQARRWLQPSVGARLPGAGGTARSPAAPGRPQWRRVCQLPCAQTRSRAAHQPPARCAASPGHLTWARTAAPACAARGVSQPQRSRA